MNFFEKVFVSMNGKGLLWFIPDRLCLKILYRIHFHKKLDLTNPKTFNEKLQWLKLYDRKPLYSMMVDKYEAKKYVAGIIGEEYIIPTYGIWDKFEDIDFDSLPNQFVLKCTHDSGGLVICKDKSQLDIQAAKKKINQSLKRNYYWAGREWPYKKVKPRIIAEKYMEDHSGGLTDYKIHNFNGKPQIILECSDRYSECGLKQDFFTKEWKHIDVKRPGHNNAESIPVQPESLKKMLDLSEKLANNQPFLRTDFYTINDKIYFGELTFYPASGLNGFDPASFDEALGKLTEIPDITSGREASDTE